MANNKNKYAIFHNIFLIVCYDSEPVVKGSIFMDTSIYIFQIQTNW